MSLLGSRAPFGFREANANDIEIALVNNMPSAALESTERQFRARLEGAAAGIAVKVTFYALADVPRTDAGQRHVRSYYSRIDDLWDRHIDGLIVTGTEPREPNLTNEPYWRGLTTLFEWAERHTYSTLLSCLAAHAAVLHMDGIYRRHLSNKCFGVFECTRASHQVLTAGCPDRVQMPHSRWNEIPADVLATCGYQILTKSHYAGVDMFLKKTRSLFVFLQGHPEYETETLLLEYRRDIKRFLIGESKRYPSMPEGYFDPETAARFTVAHKRALSHPSEDMLSIFPFAFAASRVQNTWSNSAFYFYRNWLLYLCAQKERHLRGRPRQSECTPLKKPAPANP